MIQAQIEDGIDLSLRQRITAIGHTGFGADENAPLFNLSAAPFICEQFDAGLFPMVAGPDDVDELVQIGEGDEITLEQFGALLGFAKFKTGATQDDLTAMFNVALNHFLEVKRLGLAVIDRQRIHAEGHFQLGMLKQVVDDHLGIGITAEFEDQARVLIGLIAHGADFRDDLFVDEVGDFLLERRPVHVVRDFGDDDLLAIPLQFLNANATAQFDAALAGEKIILDPFDAANDAPGGKVRALDVQHQFGNGNGGLVNLGANPVDDFAQIVRRHVGGHADGDARAAIDQEIGKRGREDRWLGHSFVVIGNEIDRVAIHVGHERGAEVGETSLGITHGGGRIIFNGAEITFALHETFTHGPWLRHVNQRGINDRFTMGMIVTAGVTTDLGAFVRLASWKQGQLVHRVQNPALRRL